MSDQSGDSGFFGEVLASQTALVKCETCGADAPVNTAYLPYLNGRIKACRKCRCSEASNFDL